MHADCPEPYQSRSAASTSGDPYPYPDPTAASIVSPGVILLFSSNTSQSFTQWRFPLSNSTISHHSYSQPQSEPVSEPEPTPDPPLTDAGLENVFRVAEIQFSSGTEPGRFGAVHLLERSLVPNPHSAGDGGACPSAVVRGVVQCLREGVARKAASKVLLALCLAEGNRRSAVEAGAVTAVVEALADAEIAVSERSLAALELLCTTSEGAAEVKAHALAVPMMVQVMGRMEGRGKGGDLRRFRRRDWGGAGRGGGACGDASSSRGL
ncbi:hypothetical protein OROGR_010797 [Orobanche gracilis]